MIFMAPRVGQQSRTFDQSQAFLPFAVNYYSLF